MAERREGHADLRVVKTREAIREAFRGMVCEMPAEKITVKGIADRARIHRKTFYLHYTSIEALYEDMLADLAGRYAEAVEEVSADMPTEEVNRVFFEYMANLDEFEEKLLTEPAYRDFCTRLFAVNMRHNRERHNPYAHLPQAEQDIVNAFLVASSLDMYSAWASGGRAVPLERMVELSGGLLARGANSVRQG